MRAGIEFNNGIRVEDERAGTQFSPLQALGLRIMGWIGIGIAIGLAGLLGALG